MMPFGGNEEWRVRHDISSDVSDAEAARQVRYNVAEGMDPVMSDYKNRTEIIQRNLGGLANIARSDPERFLAVVDEMREDGTAHPYLDEIVHQSLFGEQTPQVGSSVDPDFVKSMRHSLFGD